MSEKKKVISVMIPTYNEEENARPIYEAVRDELVKSCPNYDYEILFIDNKSEDGTRAIIRQICTGDAVRLPWPKLRLATAAGLWSWPRLGTVPPDTVMPSASTVRLPKPNRSVISSRRLRPTCRPSWMT